MITVVVYWILSLNNENELKGLDCHRSVSFSASCGEPTVSVCWGVNVPIQGTPWVPCKTSKHFVPVCDLYTNCTRCKSHDRIWGQGNTAKFTLHSAVCTAHWRLNIYGRCKSRTTNFCEKGSCRCWAPNKVPSAHFTLSSAHCTLQVTLHTACSKFHNSCHCTLQMHVLGNWSILCRIIIRRQWMQQRLIFVKHLFAKRV